MPSSRVFTFLYHILLLCVSLALATITCDHLYGDETIQNCTLGNDSAEILDEFPLHAQVARILYANNQRAIHDISSTAFDSFTNLEYLYLNDNSLRTVSAEWFKKLENISYINLSGNFISYVNDKAFLQCKQIYAIELSRNLIEDFRYPSNELYRTTLYLSKNPLERIEIGPVDRLYVDETNLTELHLQNDIRDIYASNSRISSFSAPNSLEVLYLEGNDLSNITNITALHRLWILNLSGNNIGTPSPDAFLNLNRLEYLYLSQTNISHLHYGLFANQGSLSILDLSGNNIGTPSPDAFLNLHKLGRLNLSQTSISRLSYGLFANQEHLWELDLSENKISHFNTNHLRRTQGNKTLEILPLHNNPINTITDDGILLKNLHSFHLGGNSSGLDCQKLLDLYTTYKNIEVPEHLKRFDIDNVGGIGCHDPNISSIVSIYIIYNK